MTKKNEVANRPPKTWAYLRVSTDVQDTDNQRLEVLRLAQEQRLGDPIIIEETASGRRAWRDRRIKEILDQAVKGDTLIVAELSRLGRSMLEVMEILAIAADRGLRIHAAKGKWTLDESLPSKIVATVLAMAAEIERELISQRTKAALATRRAAGVKLGRPPGPGASKLDARRGEIEELLGYGVPLTRVAQRVGSSPANLRRWLKVHRSVDAG